MKTALLLMLWVFMIGIGSAQTSGGTLKAGDNISSFILKDQNNKEFDIKNYG